MPAPKSVVKINNNGIEFTDSVDKANYYIFELTRAALRDVSRFVRKRFREEYYKTFKKHTRQGPKAISYVIYSSKKTLYPRAEIGIKHAANGKPVPGFYTYFHEVGTAKEPKRGLLQSVVESNIDQIRQIEAQYLSAIENEQEADSLIDGEDDYTSEDDRDV